MSNVTIQIIRALANKTPIPEFQAKVIKIHPRKTGTNARGPWSMQRVELRDPNGEDITCLITEQDEFPFRPGDQVVLASHVGDKGSTGVYVYDDTYNEKTERQIKVTATGRIDLIGVQNQAPAQEREREREHAPAGAGQQRQQVQETAAPQSQSTTSHGSQNDRDKTDVRAAKKVIVQIVNLHTLCVLAVDRVEAPLVEGATGSPMSDSQRQASIASTFIKAERSGLVDKMPCAPFKPEEIA
jgi:hypothetical protein